jgi:hypothetical protein
MKKPLSIDVEDLAIAALKHELGREPTVDEVTAWITAHVRVGPHITMPSRTKH